MNMKKVFSLLLALMMVMGLGITAFAAGTTTTITAPNNSRTYQVYQIMTGDLATGEGGAKVLSNVKWGSNAKKTGSVTQEDMNAIAAISGTEAEKAAKIAEYVKLEDNPFKTVSNGESVNVPTGYYLIKDNGPVGDGEAYSLFVVQVVGPTTISPKTGTTSSQKKVKDTNDSKSGSTTDWQDSADYDIGDAVPFQLKAIVASDYANYKNGYKLTFHDKESDGLTFNADSVKVYVDGVEINSGYSVNDAPVDGDTFDVVFANLKDIAVVHANSVITVEYTSTLNQHAKIGKEGNPNTMHITYTNNPNDTQAGENGKTPDDTVIVFTYKFVVNKVKPDNSPLAGAGFTLYKKAAGGDYSPIGEEVKGEAMTEFTWTGIDDGEYKLVETTTPAGYNTMADLEFTVSAEHDVLADNPKLTNLTCTIPDFTAVADTGLIRGNIVNQTGASLPETGGTGTMMFAFVGTMLTLGAAVLIITRKKMSVYED